MAAFLGGSRGRGEADAYSDVDLCVIAKDDAYDALVEKSRTGKLGLEDMLGTTFTLTNPGGLGTVASVPRLMQGQAAIIATGSINFPVEYQHLPKERLAELGVAKVMTMTSTYDHRVIQGAESGSFLRRIEQLLAGEDDFYENVATALGIEASVVATAHAASASAPPLAAASATAAPATWCSASAERNSAIVLMVFIPAAPRARPVPGWPEPARRRARAARGPGRPRRLAGGAPCPHRP